MKRLGSRLANNIDMEYRRKEDYFKRHYCDHCKNTLTNLCEIRPTIDHQFKCIYYEKEDK